MRNNLHAADISEGSLFLFLGRADCHLDKFKKQKLLLVIQKSESDTTGRSYWRCVTDDGIRVWCLEGRVDIMLLE